jgi:hypothetical protein
MCVALLRIMVQIYSSLWTLICDAKTRKRRPNGTIITADDELAASVKAKSDLAAKAELWAAREEQLRSDF